MHLFGTYNPLSMGEARSATLLERMKRLLGGDTGRDVVQPGLLTSFAPYPGEVYRRDANISVMRNTARARQIMLEEKLKQQRKLEAKRRAEDAQQAEWDRKAFETFEDEGGVPEGRPSYIRENTMTNPMMILDAVKLHEEMNKPGGKVRL